MSSFPRTPVLGVGVSAVSLESATAAILAWVSDWHRGERASHYVAVTGVHGLIEAQDDPSFKQILNRSGLTVPDGMPLVWLSWLAGRQDVTRVYGPDLTLRVSSALASAGYSSFYYGGAPGVADDLAARMNRRFPGLRCAGTLSPPYRALTQDEEEDIVRTIASSGADVVWVGLSTPKQERWMARFQDRLDTPVLIGVGAAFDFLTDRIPQAPGWMQKSGLEWLFRLGAEPRRLWSRYLRNNPLFLYYLTCEKLGLRDFGS